MVRLAATLGISLTLLIAVDQMVPFVIEGDDSARRMGTRRAEAFVGLAAQHAEALRRDLRIRLLRVHDLWESLPSVKARGEMRVFVIGNSAAIFSVIPEIVQARIAVANPDRAVTVVPLLVEGLLVEGERILVQAALAKGADVIVMTPNLKGLRPGGAGRLRQLFRSSPPESFVERTLDMLRSFLRSHWNLYRYRFEVRAWFGHALLSRQVGIVDMNQAFEQIAEAAGQGDLTRVLRIYRDHRLGGLAGGTRRELPPDSPVFATVRATAREVGAASAVSVAIFLPVNPLFRDVEATRSRPRLRQDDEYTRELAARVLGIYEQQGVATFEALDVLPASAFVDLVHVNDSGSKIFSEWISEILVDEIARRAAPGGD